MAMTIDRVEQAFEPVGKSALCRLLGWSRPTLDLRLETDSLFPVAKRGAKGGGWKFDAVAVIAYLAGRTHPVAASACRPSPVDTRPHTTSIPHDEAFAHSGERTARQRRDAVQAEILEDKLRRERGELVQTEAMRQVIAMMLAHLDKGFDRLRTQIVKRIGIPEADPVVRELLDELRSAIAADLRPLLE